MNILIVSSNIVTAWDEKAIGSKIVKPNEFMVALHKAVAAHDSANDRQPGQHYIVLSPEANDMVSSGVGPASANEEDYVLRAHRGQVSAYLKRPLAAPVTSVAVVIYTAAAYLSDPECEQEESRRVTADNPSHVLVAVLAAAGPPSPLSPYRLVHSLAGGNLVAAMWGVEEIHAKAVESINYHSNWSVVAD